MAGEVSKIEGELKTLPWWVWAGAGGVALGLVFYFRKAGASTPPITMDGATQLPDGLEPFDLSGLPFGADATGAFEPTDPGAPTQTNVGDPGVKAEPGPGQIGPAPPRLPPNRINPPAPPAPTPTPTPTPTSEPPHVNVTVGNWPNWNGSLSGIAAHYGKSLQALEAFDGNQARVFAEAHAHGVFGNEWDHIYPGELIEVPE